MIYRADSAELQQDLGSILSVSAVGRWLCNFPLFALFSGFYLVILFVVLMNSVLDAGALLFPFGNWLLY